MELRFAGFCLVVTDTERCIRFYENVTMERSVARGDSDSRFVPFMHYSVWQRDFLIAVVGRDLDDELRERLSGVHLIAYYQTDDIDQAFDELSQRGLDLIHGVREEDWGQKTFRFFDPEGNIIEVATL